MKMLSKTLCTVFSLVLPIFGTTQAACGTTTTTNNDSSSGSGSSNAVVSSSSAAAATASIAAATSTISVAPATTKPALAYVVPKDFVGFGIESGFLTNYANNFSQNLVSSVGKRMAAAPIIRLGGTSGDLFTFDPNQTEDTVCISGDCPRGSDASYILGPSYFEGYKWFPDAKFTIQAPLGGTVNITNTLDYVQRAYANLGTDRTAAIALGNEPGYYDSTAKLYVTDALEIEASIVEALGLTGDAAKIFEAGNIASDHAATTDLYRITQVLNNGINNNDLIQSTAEHYYQISSLSTYGDIELQDLMLNHSAITSRLTHYAGSIASSQNASLPYIMSEDSAVLGGAPIHFQGGFAYTLWAVDFGLACMSRGVARVANLAGRPSAQRQFWVPDDSAPANPGPQVRAPFPAAPFLADFIGGSDAADTAVAEIDLDAETHPFLSAYAVYNTTTTSSSSSSSLSRVALLNLDLYNATAAVAAGRARTSKAFAVAVGDGVTSVTVRRLHADLGVAAMGYDYAGPASNVTWAGEQWSYAIDNGNGHFVTGAAETETVAVTDGVATIVVPACEAVIITVG
ncbi:hypothetical protein BX600DRAFT_492108 [Xylariales sp. PMI_506]|nr:hypothetical protein BX600DRAFT_492108 [Xylariales sp. PMI_506]